MPELPAEVAPNIVHVPDEWLLAAAVEAHNDGRDRLEDFDADHLEFLRDGLAAVLPLVAGHIADLIVANVRGEGQDRGGWWSPSLCMAYVDGHDKAARIAREAFTTSEIFEVKGAATGASEAEAGLVAIPAADLVWEHEDGSLCVAGFTPDLVCGEGGGPVHPRTADHANTHANTHANSHGCEHGDLRAALARVHQVCRQALATDSPDRWMVAAEVRHAIEEPGVADAEAPAADVPARDDELVAAVRRAEAAERRAEYAALDAMGAELYRRREAIARRELHEEREAHGADVIRAVQAVAERDRLREAMARVREACLQVTSRQVRDDGDIGEQDHAMRVLKLLDGAGAVPGEHTGGGNG